MHETTTTTIKNNNNNNNSNNNKQSDSNSNSNKNKVSAAQQQQQQQEKGKGKKEKGNHVSSGANTNKSLSAYPFERVDQQSNEARREQLLNAIDWGVVENGEEALRIFDEQAAKTNEEKKTKVEIFFDETPNARIFAKFVVFPLVLSQTMNYSFISPYFENQFKDMGEKAASEMLPMHLRLDILTEVNRSEQMREYDIQMGRAPQLSDKQKTQVRIDEAREIEQKTIELRKKELANRWTDIAFVSAFLMAFFGRRSAAKDWIEQSKKWFFDLGPANQAFILLLSSDVLVGYHSADGWNTVLESLGEKYGITDNHAAISIFTALVPVGMDVLFKFWVFKYLRKLAPSTQIILDDIDRH